MRITRAQLFGRHSPRTQSLSLSVGRVVQALMTMVAPVVLVRVLDQVDYGHYRKIVLVLTTVHGLLLLSLTESLFYYVSRSDSPCHALVRRTLLSLFGLGLFGAAVVGLAAPRLEAALEVPLTPYLPWILAYIVMQVPATLAYVLPTVDQRAQVQALFAVVLETLRTALLAIAVLVTGRLDVLVVVLCVYAGLKLAVLVLYLYARRTDEASVTEVTPTFSDQLRYSLPMWGAAVIMLARDHAHSFFVAGMFDSVEFAIYAVGTMAIPFLPFVNEIIGNVMLIQTARQFREDDLEEMRRVWFRALHNLALALIPIFVVLEVFAGDLVITVFGAEYAASVPVFRVYLLMILSLVPQLGSPLLKATRDTRLHLLADLASAVASLGILVFAAQTRSISLAALSPTVGYVVFALAVAPVVARRMQLPILHLYPLTPILKIAACAGFSCLLPYVLLLPSGAPVRLLVGGPVAGLLFALSAWRLGIIQASERDLVRTILNRVLPAGAADRILDFLGP